MQGLAYKATIVTLFSLAYLSSPAFSASSGNTTAGCMSCHQAEAIVADVAPAQSSHHQSSKNHKQHTPQQVSKVDIFPE
jgi:hypothetical protein